MPRNFATLGPSELQPPFTGNSKKIKIIFFLLLQHWAGVSLNTSFYKLAETWVFIKLLPPPIFYELYKITLITSLLLPKLRSHFAEFLQNNSFKRLNARHAFTWVGLGTGFYLIFFLENTIILSLKPFNKNNIHILSY